MANEKLVIPNGADLKFVRAGTRFSLGDINAEHQALVRILGLRQEEVKQDTVDMGEISRSDQMICVRGSSFKFKWPPDNKPEIRAETINQLQKNFPDFDVF